MDAYSLGEDAYSLGTDAFSLGTSKHALGTAKGSSGPQTYPIKCRICKTERVVSPRVLYTWTVQAWCKICRWNYSVTDTHWIL